VNTVHLIGQIGNDPELRLTGAGQPVVNLSMATNEFYNDKQGAQQIRTEWHRLVFWGEKAELVNKYVNRGDQLGVEGKLQSRRWTNHLGHKKLTVEVTVSRVHLLGDIWNLDRLPTAVEEEEAGVEG
jgi:single-strand DNA-binding protein